VLSRFCCSKSQKRDLYPHGRGPVPFKADEALASHGAAAFLAENGISFRGVAPRLPPYLLSQVRHKKGVAERPSL